MKSWIVYSICVFLLFSLAGCGPDPDIILKGNESSAVSEEQAGQDDGDESSPKDQEAANIYVYICGAVCSPGVYEMAPDSRVYELVDAAGGMSGDADGQSVNLAETVSDGQMVRIPFCGETNAGGEEAGESGAPGISSDGKVNINTASAEQLMTLSGIGQTKADQIIAYREKNGAFPNIEAIMQVSGIAEGTYEKIKDSITVQ